MALLRFSDERPDEEIKASIQDTITDAMSLWSPLTFGAEYPTGAQFGISEIRPFHIQNTTTLKPQTCNLNYWQTSTLIASSWNDWINVSLNKDTYVITTGLFNLEPVTTADLTELNPLANGVNLPVVNVEQLYALDVARAWFTKPFTTTPSSTLQIQAYAKAGGSNQGSNRIGLLGHTVAKRYQLVTKN